MSGENQENKTSVKASVPNEIRNAPKIGTPTKMGEVILGQYEPLLEHHKEFSEFHEGYVSRYIQLADTKASWVFALTSALLVFMVSDSDLNKLYLVLKGDLIGTSIIIIIFAFLLMGALFSFLVIAPNLRSPSGESLVFFKSVADQKDSGTYVTNVAKLDDHEMTNLRLQHCYDLSKVCTRKYKYLKRSIWLGAIGAFLLVALVFLRTF